MLDDVHSYKTIFLVLYTCVFLQNHYLILVLDECTFLHIHDEEDKCT